MPPEADKIPPWPQLILADPEAITFIGGTDTVMVSEFVHPSALVPMTVYVVVDNGVTITDEPTNPTGCHRYVLAPVADKVPV